LAAGRSQRFGGPKLLMPFGGTTVIGQVVAALAGAGLDPIVVVAGGEAEGIGRALAGGPAEVVVNPDPERGMLSSARVGIEALPDDVERIVVALGDQPSIRPDHIWGLLGAQQGRGKGIAVAVHGGKRGHPVVFEGRYREAILSGGEHATLRDVIHCHGDDVVEVECGSDAVLRDIDTREQYLDELEGRGRER
jgi:molybdenum cofactor cytidylyltransferase